MILDIIIGGIVLWLAYFIGRNHGRRDVQRFIESQTVRICIVHQDEASVYERAMRPGGN